LPPPAPGVSQAIGNSELYSFAVPPQQPLDYTQQLQRSTRLLADATAQRTFSFSRQSMLLYTPNASVFRQYPSPATLSGLRAPVLVAVGTLDPNTPHGLGGWFTAGIRRANTAGIQGQPAARLLTVPWAAHGLFAANSPCVNGVLAKYVSSWGGVLDAACLDELPVPDFGGCSAKSAQLAKTWFGSEDMWNQGGDLPPAYCTAPTPQAPTPQPAAQSDKCECCC